jgi:hypothetical protein
MDLEELNVLALPDVIKKETSLNIYMYYYGNILATEDLYGNIIARRSKKFVIWLIKTYSFKNKKPSIGEYTVTLTDYTDRSGNKISVRSFRFNTEFNNYCCGIQMRDCIKTYQESIGHKDLYNPWIRFKTFLCETIMDSLVVTCRDGTMQLITKSKFNERAASTTELGKIMINDDLYRLIEDSNGERYRYKKFFVWECPGSGNNHLPWRYECLLHRQKNDSDIRRAEIAMNQFVSELGKFYLIL